MGRQVGIASITVDTLTDGVQVTERLGLDLPIHPTSSRSQYTTQYTLGTDLRLREFRVTLPGRAGPVVMSGLVEGDSQIVVSPGTGAPRWRVPVRGLSLVPPLAAPVVMARQQRFNPGESMDVPVYDPVTLAPKVISLTVLQDSVFLVPDSADFDSTAGRWIPAHADTLEAFRLAWSDGNLATEIWVDRLGLPIRIQNRPGLWLDRSAFEITTINYRRQRDSVGPVVRGSVDPRTAIAAGVIPARNVAGMRLRIGEGTIAWIPPRDTSPAPQYMENGVLVTTRVTLAPGRNYPLTDSSQVNWLADGAWLDLGESAIQDQARSLAEAQPDGRALAASIAAWVSSNIARVPDLLVPRAAMVLRERQADVDGHTLLFVALARAAGLPARPVSGILLAENRFYFHSWAEVWLGRWIPVDPTWGEMPASANRVRMGTGTLAQPQVLLPLSLSLDLDLLTLTSSP